MEKKYLYSSAIALSFLLACVGLRLAASSGPHPPRYRSHHLCVDNVVKETQEIRSRKPLVDEDCQQVQIQKPLLVFTQTFLRDFPEHQINYSGLINARASPVSSA
jgi:hypothetical protein